MDMQLVAWIAAALVFSSFFMKTMMPLRMIAIASNVAFISYGILGIHYGLFDKVIPILVLHVALLFLNILRLRQLQKTIRQIQTVSGNKTIEFLIPFMTRESASKGQTLFSKGDAADKVFLLQKGSVWIYDYDKLLKPGDFFGEVGIFSDEGVRTATVVCEEDCEFFTITGKKVIELFYQDPRFGFFIVRALSRYAQVSLPYGVVT